MNLSYAYIDGVRTRVLLDNGSQINSVTPAYAHEHDMVIGSLQELAGDPSGNLIQGMGGCQTGVLGYVVFHIQIEGMKSYDEEQVALVVADDTKFGHRVPIILGMPTIHRVIRSMKESEMENASPKWERIQVAYEATNLLFSYRVTCDAGEKKSASTQYPMNTKINPIDIDERIYLTKPVEVPTFGSVIAQGHMESTMMMGHCLRVMTQVPYPDNDANLPVGLYVLRTYTELHDGSRTAHVVLRNGTSRPIHLRQCQVVGRVVAANLVPEAEVMPEFMKKLSEDDADTDEKEKSPKLTILEWQQLLIEILERDGGLDMLKDWPEKEALDACRLLMQFHHVFSLDKNEMGCTDTTEHVIKLTNSEPFKERFRRITLPLVEEVHKHIQEMLDGGAIRPSNSPWCNAVVLVRKKDGTLRFCIDFFQLNERTEKDSFPMPRMIDTMETMVGVKIFSSMDLKFWLLAGQDGRGIAPVHRFHCRQSRGV